MAIPKLLKSSEDGKVEINQDFINFNEFKNWTPERQIEALWNLVRENVFSDSFLPEKKIDKAMQAFNGAYGLAKLKFQDIKRNTGGRYFDHLIRVMQYIVITSKNPSIKKTIIAICHDLIEDTDISFSTLREIFGTYIAFGILLISKKNVKDFIYNNKDDIEIFQTIEKSGILNYKGLIGDEFLQRKTYFPESITTEEKTLEKLYKDLEKKYKETIHNDFFSHMLSNTLDVSNQNQKYYKIISEKTPNLNNFYNYALYLVFSSDLKIRLSDDEIKNICFDSLEVKFYDRIDNLETAEVYHEFNKNGNKKIELEITEDIKKAKRKIRETKCYFYPIVKEFDEIKGTDFYKIMSGKVEALEIYIFEKEKTLTGENSKSRIGYLLK